jgi:hypothetical protein
MPRVGIDILTNLNGDFETIRKAQHPTVFDMFISGGHEPDFAGKKSQYLCQEGLSKFVVPMPHSEEGGDIAKPAVPYQVVSLFHATESVDVRARRWNPFRTVDDVLRQSSFLFQETFQGTQ